MRILHLTAGSDAGGVSRYIFDLCSAMSAAGHQVAVAGERGAWHDLFAAAPFPWIDAPLKGGPLTLLRAPASSADISRATPSICSIATIARQPSSPGESRRAFLYPSSTRCIFPTCLWAGPGNG